MLKDFNKQVTNTTWTMDRMWGFFSSNLLRDENKSTAKHALVIHQRYVLPFLLAGILHLLDVLFWPSSYHECPVSPPSYSQLKVISYKIIHVTPNLHYGTLRVSLLAVFSSQGPSNWSSLRNIIQLYGCPQFMSSQRRRQPTILSGPLVSYYYLGPLDWLDTQTLKSISKKLS